MNYAKKHDIAQLAQGIAVIHLYPSQLYKLVIAIPTPKEQEKIADCLASLDELIENQRAKIDNLKEHKRALVQQLFPAMGKSTPTIRFPEFNNGQQWSTQTLENMTSKVGSGITPNGGDKNYKKNGRPFVRSQNVGCGRLLLDDMAFIDERTHSTFSGTQICINDVLVNITGASIGRCAVADFRIEGGNVNQHVCIIRTTEGLNPFYLSQYLISKGGQGQIDSFQAGGNRQGLNFAQIRSFAIPMPPEQKEQKKIADCLGAIDELILVQEKEIKNLRAHKKGLMQQLFPVNNNMENGK